MNRSVTDSPSIVLRATHIALIAVASVDEGPWQAGPRRSQVQDIHLGVTVVETLKGPPLAPAGASLRVAGTRARPGPRDSVASGVWSPVELSAGARLLIFSAEPTTDTAAIFAEPALLEVLPASPAEGEVRRVLAIERAGGPIASWIGGVAEPPALSSLFGHYVVARLAEEAHSKYSDAFDATMRWLEDAGRGAPVQATIIEALTSRVLMAAPGAAGSLERLALAELRILTSTRDETLAAQVEGTYLPNLLGLEGAAPRKTAAALLGADAAEKARIRAALQRRPPGPARDRLLDWLGH